MNGHDVADAQAENVRVAEERAILAWAESQLRRRESEAQPMTTFERELLARIERVNAM